MSRLGGLQEVTPLVRDDDEGLFSRDISGQLVRLDAPTEDDYGKTVKLHIDGRPVDVALAEPLKDAQGNIVLDLDGRTTPRYTTIYDAAAKLYVQRPGDEAKVPIPVLCHQPHMTPVAVCRLCAVQVYGQKRGKRAAERRLLPACQHQVKDGMEVFTQADPGPDGERVRRVVRVLTELLAADHLKPAPPPAPAEELAPHNELQQMAERCGASVARFRLDVLGVNSNCGLRISDCGVNGAVGPSSNPQSEIRNPKSVDSSSPVFLVDHSACILCDRCSRACDEVKQNHVIGRTGKGASAGIAFDLDDPMGRSSCVQCGECMVSCPTSAITFKPVAQVKAADPGHDGGGGSAAEVLPAAELMRDPLFAGVPPKFLLWQQGLAVRRHVSAGDVLCRQGEPGNTAYIMKSGRYEITGWPAEKKQKRGLLSLLIRGRKADDGAGMRKPLFRAERSPADVILGEMACLSGTPRSATIAALEPGEVWEVRRNVLDRLMRSPAQRARFEELYRTRALETVLRGSELFEGLPADEYARVVEFLRPRLSFVRVSPGQVIFRQGDWAQDMYLVRLGHVRVGISRGGIEEMMLYRGPGSTMGEIGLLAISPEDVAKGATRVDAGLAEILAGAGGGLTAALPAGRRSATCSALDHVELARLTRREFLEMVRTFPLLRRRLVDLSLARLGGGAGGAAAGERPLQRQYVEQGLYQGQSLLVLDLTRCTHCDECTRACVQQHGRESHGIPVTRLLREGLRFGDHLVATSCRSCKDAYCMVGCPVDAIHRGKHQQIVIEDHCIGCGLCATNCPYGNIWMIADEGHRLEVPDPERPGRTTRVAQPKAATCDLCDADGELDEPKPRCVYACPHDAAHRMSGEELLKRVN